MTARGSPPAKPVLTGVLALSALAVLLCLLAVRLFEIDVWQGPDGPVFHQKDDNMITLRVAAVMAETGLPYFNAGEAVAANTSLFWPMVMAPVLDWVGAERFPLVLFYASALMVALAVVAVAGLVRGGLATALVVVAILGNPGIVSYGGSGWEHIPQMLALSLGFGAFLANTRREFGLDALGFGAVCVAFALRPDGVALAVGAWAILAFSHLRSRPVAVVVVSALGLVVPVAYLALMLHFYGDTVPNTFHLKDAGRAELTRGLVYLATPHMAGWVPLVVLLTAAALWRRGAPVAGVRDRAVVLILLVHVALSALSGGDVFAGGRFYLSILPVAFVLAVRAGSAGRPGWGGVVVAAVLVLPIGVPSAEMWRGAPGQRDTLDGSQKMTSHVELAALIADRLTPEDGSVGLHRLGHGYHLRAFHVVDFLGKAEPHIARTPAQTGPKGHNKWDYDHALTAYDIAVAPFPMSEADLLVHAELPPHNWMYLWVFGRKMMAEGYTLLTPEELGLSRADWGLWVRPGLVERFKTAG